ncbi:NERD domain-containing protein [Nocardia sp. NPDC019395]|uniref:nuclease-related domain-containing protein n=1 Tax=Nocardia sp. NPDC019395 TaxID=3154686 RepID=UPI0033F7A909
MLVIADKLRSGSEKRVVAWLRKWQDDYRVPGIAIANCFVGGQEVDLVIITPHTTVVCEVKGLNPGVTAGVLHCTSNSRWKVPGYEGDPVGVRQSDTTPYDQVRDAVFKLKSVAAKAGGPTFVTGLVVVVPPRESTLRLDKKSAPQGCDVLLCNTQNPLRAWFHRAHHRSAVVWTAEQAYALVDALEHGDSTTVDGLAAEGFPLEMPAPPAVLPPEDPPPRTASAPKPAPARRIPPKPVTSETPPAPPSRISTRPHIEDHGRDTGRAAAPAEPLPDPSPAEPAPEPRSLRNQSPATSGDRPRDRYRTAAALAAIVVLSAGIWFVAQIGGHRTQPQETTGQLRVSSVTEQPPPAPPAAPVPRHTPPTRTVCYPFQPNCG